MQVPGPRAARGAVAPMLAPASLRILGPWMDVQASRRCELLAVVLMECIHTAVSESVRYTFEILPVMGFIA